MKGTVMNFKTITALVAYMATIPAANWMISHVGTEAFPGGPHTIPVGFGYTAPSGVLLIGVALAARDYVQKKAGYGVTLAAIAVGVALSYWVNPVVAMASAVAFCAGELVDFAIYTPLAKDRLALAVLASGVVGGAIDTFIFLRIAFGSINFWQGQIIGKSAVAAAAALVVYGYRRTFGRLSLRGV